MPLDPPVDYRSLSPSPPRMIEAGRYEAGWFASFDGELNHGDARRGSGRLSSWLHVTFDTPTHFVGAHVANLGLAGHTSVLVVDKEKQEAIDRSQRSMLWRNGVTTDPGFSTFNDARTHSHIAMTPDGGVELEVSVKGLTLKARAEPAFSVPFVQTTGYPDGKGTLQWWGNLRLIQGEVCVDGLTIPLPAGALGAYDRTVGHRRRVQNWNWLSASGMATHKESGEPTPFSMQMSKDRPRAQPVVSAAKTTLWVGDAMLKLPSIAFEYSVLDGEKNTGPWAITSEGEAAGMALTFKPRFKRREKGAIPLIYQADFNQYYGSLTGEFWTGEERYLLDEVFALTEDSFLKL